MDTAQRLQQMDVDRYRQRAAAALASPAETLDNDQRDLVRSLAVSVELLGRILISQEDPGCVQHYEEALELHRRTGARRDEATVGLNLGNAYLDVLALYDLDQVKAGTRPAWRCAARAIGLVALYASAHSGGSPWSGSTTRVPAAHPARSWWVT